MIFQAAKNGLTLWFNQLIPSLFPFLVLTAILTAVVNYDGLVIKNSKIKKSRPIIFGVWLLGHFCGYPIGAKITADLYRRGKLCLQEANYLVMCANQASPAFLYFFVIDHILKQTSNKMMILAILYFASILNSIFAYGIYLKCSSTQAMPLSIMEEKKSPLQLLDDAIYDAFSTLIRIGGYMILFSILQQFILAYFPFPQIINVFLAASAEITTGLELLRQTITAPHLLLFIVLIYTAFGGFCTFAQIKGMLAGTSLSIKPYIIGKCLYTFLVILILLVFVFFHSII